MCAVSVICHDHNHKVAHEKWLSFFEQHRSRISKNLIYKRIISGNSIILICITFCFLIAYVPLGLIKSHKISYHNNYKWLNLPYDYSDYNRKLFMREWLFFTIISLLISFTIFSVVLILRNFNIRRSIYLRTGFDIDKIFLLKYLKDPFFSNLQIYRLFT